MSDQEEFAARFAELRAGYLERLPALFEEIRCAAEAGDREQVLCLLHRLKGSAGSYGVLELSQDAAECEQRIRDRVEDAMAPMLAPLAQRLQSL